MWEELVLAPKSIPMEGDTCTLLHDLFFPSVIVYTVRLQSTKGAYKYLTPEGR